MIDFEAERNRAPELTEVISENLSAIERHMDGHIAEALRLKAENGRLRRELERLRAANAQLGRELDFYTG